MTPMIDVIFNLLIFFVCTASFRPPEQVLPTMLSSLGASSTVVPLPPEIVELEDVVIKVLAVDGRIAWQINQQSYERLEQVREVLLAIAGLQADLPIILDVQGEVPLGDVIDLYDLCRLVGFDKIQFAANVGN
jgi:biopolymer transport protein ExbD